MVKREFSPGAGGAKLYPESEMGNLNTSVTTTAPQAGEFAALHPQNCFLEPHWYAAYTCANHERRVVGEGARAEPHPFLTAGRRVRLTAGPFAGLEGILKRKKGNLRVVVSLELIQRSVVVDVDAADVRPLGA